MKMMSECGIKTGDWIYASMYDDYQSMKQKKEKFRYIIAVLSDRYGISESTVKRVIRRLSCEVKM